MQKEEKQSLKKAIACSFCGGTDIIKRGIRKKKLERVQIYYCKKCDKRFTPYITKHRTYPLRIILEVLTQYNRLKYKNEIISYISQIYGIAISEKNISDWITDFSEYIPFLRLRKYIKLKYDRRNIIQESKMFHKQIYQFMYHQAKLKTLLQENYKNSKMTALYDFLELVIPECPHQIFKRNIVRASNQKAKFNLDGVKIITKTTFACKITNFVMQAVTNSKMRHKTLQDFMIINDSVTVATEVSVLLTEHIDILQLRN